MFYLLVVDVDYYYVKFIFSLEDRFLGICGIICIVVGVISKDVFKGVILLKNIVYEFFGIWFVYER